MSKGNMLLGMARGKVGDLVFSRSNGQQVTRARATNIKNPQTEAQMIQRIILNTVAQAYSRFGAICDHSFEGVQAGQKSVSYFMSKNMDSLRSKIAREIAEGYDLSSIFAFSPVNSNQYASNEYIISKGTLPMVTVTPRSGVNAEIAIAENTYQGVCDALGLQRGDQLTFVATQGTTGERTSFYFARVILNPTNPDGSLAEMSAPFVVDGAINQPSVKNEGQFNMLTLEGGVLSFNFSAQPMSGAACIVSRQAENGTWLRSNATLYIDDVAVAGWQLSMQECLDLFAVGGVETVNSRILNNAGVGRVAVGGTGSFTVQDLAGNNVTITSYKIVDFNGDDIVEFTASDGRKMYCQQRNVGSRKYGEYLSSTEGYEGEAFNADASPATAADQIIPIFGIDTANAKALVSGGISETCFINNDGDSDTPSITSVKYGLTEGQENTDWPSEGNVNLGIVDGVYIKINGSYLSESGYLEVCKDDVAQSLSGTSSQKTAHITGAGVYSLKLARLQYGGTLTVSSDGPQP